MSDKTEERCNTTLGLGTGGGGNMMKKENSKKQYYSSKNNNNNKKGFWLDLSLPLHPKSDDHKKNIDGDDEKDDHQDSFSNRSIDDDQQQEDEEDQEDERRVKRSSSNANVVYNSSTDNNGSRKKLKLTNEQTTLLEDSFKIHSTLNTGQKQDLAKKLNLLPRQIEVWFQNRRARTKLKQIEQECELLKKCCETLTEENRRLKKELQEVRCYSLKFDHTTSTTTLPFYIRPYPTTSSAAMHHPRGIIGDETKASVAVVTGGSMGQLMMHDDNKKIE